MPVRYPESPAVEQYDDYHGTHIADPYRWLEDPNSEQTRQWIDAQNAVTSAYLERLPSRAAFRRRLTELWDYPKVSTMWKRGGRYFQFRNTGLQNQNVLYTLEALNAEPQLLLDPNTLSEDGIIALNNVAVSRDGQWLAYALSQSGSDWATWRVRNVETHEDLPDT
ncbi:MAG: S9 family peptidase, partial [Chloroflexi bacterium]|nr:S9 family peptidase [Chloroflexota bacterium]